MTPTRRGLILPIASLIAAPAIVRVQSLMPVRPVPDKYGLYPYPIPGVRMNKAACATIGPDGNPMTVFGWVRA